MEFEGPEIIHLPFNSGLGTGLKMLVAGVETKYLIRMDDDEPLTPMTDLGLQLRFLEEHDEVDLCAVQCMNPRIRRIEDLGRDYYRYTMASCGRRPKIALGSELDNRHVVMAKTPNIFLARTDSVRRAGYDENIRMIDHHEFFYRTMGIVVSVMDKRSFVFHYHNRFDNYYDGFRGDVAGDGEYIRKKHKAR